MARIWFFDTETTGLNPSKCSMHQLAYIYQVDGVVIEKRNLKFRPIEYDTLPDDWMNFNGTVSKKDLDGYMPYREAYEILRNFFDSKVDKYDRNDKIFVGGFNCQRFDIPFLDALFRKCGDEFLFSRLHGVSVDVMILASNALIDNPRRPTKFNLENVMNLFHITPEGDLHDALIDVEGTVEIYNLIC